MDDLLNLDKLAEVETRLIRIKTLMENILDLNERMQQLKTMKFYFGMKQDDTNGGKIVMQDDTPKPQQLPDRRKQGRSKLNEEQKEFVKTAYLEGELSLKEIAATVNLTVPGLKYVLKGMNLESLPSPKKGGRPPKNES